MSEILHLTRDYEVSVWTLQDSFITVLGASSAKYRGRIQNPEMKLVNDGTQEFTFSIPMYLDDGVNRIKNPIWTDVYNTSAIMGMRKIKVIFNKGQVDTDNVNWREIFKKVYIPKGYHGNVDLFNRPIVPANTFINAGYSNFNGRYGTLYSTFFTYTLNGKTYDIVVTPVSATGTVYSTANMTSYMSTITANATTIDDWLINDANSRKLILGIFPSNVTNTSNWCIELHNIQAEWDAIRATHNWSGYTLSNPSNITFEEPIYSYYEKYLRTINTFEFLITKVTKTHENDKPQCDVYCEGLAFHELGKIGYKIEFSTDVLSEENYQWYINGQTDGEEPIPTMDYWNQKKLGLELFPQVGIIDASKWYYKVDMDWSSFANIAGERKSDKIYDEEYIIAWTEDLLPKDSNSVIAYKEKSRVLDEKDSNIYNLTQRLAETFGVFCRYEYGYDDNYHIISRTVVYYNTGVKDKERKLSFTYPYSSTKVSREDDSVDIVTKMYVSTIEDNTTDSGLISITNSDANPTREDYLLNFDYLKEINTITQEQYDEINKYEKKIRKLNNDIIPLQNELLVKQDRLPRVQALAQIANNAKALDIERMNNANRLKQALTNDQNVIPVEGMNAKATLMQAEEGNETLFFNAPEKGILVDTIRIYKTMDKNGLKADSEIKDVGVPEYELNNFTRMTKIPVSVMEGNPSKMVYLTFSYSPKLYYERIEEVWKERLAKDESDYTIYHNEQVIIEARIAQLEQGLEDIRNQKQELIKEFERIMGPALREGYWTPDNYNVNTGERYTDYLQLKTTGLTTHNNQYIMATGDSDHTTLIWDTEKFEDEQESSYQLGVQQNTIYYPCILLTNAQFEYIQSNLLDEDNTNPISILYYDYKSTAARPHDSRYLRALAIGASVQLNFIYHNNEVKPVLLVTGTTNFTDAELTHLKSNDSAARLGYLTTTISNNKTVVVAEPTSNSNLNIGIGQWLTLTASTPLVYPRCKIDSLSLKNNESDLNISLNSNLLKEFEDYYVFQRVDNATESNYYITFKPETLFKRGYNGRRLAVNFVLSNASTAVYLDAREILKENSKPKVTYTVDPSVFYEDFIRTEYNALNTIAFINDYELEFNWVQGYISQVDLNLDFPGEDKIEIKNYKNKFEDLFSTIVAQTEAMEKNESVFSSIGKVIGIDGSIIGSALQGALKKVDLNYAFNNGKLTISEKDGIWGISDDGVVAFRGGGIFTANQKDENGNWIWNTGIVPQGINANLITAGQLDTNKIMVYAGDRLRFQLNGDGLFAYKSFLSDFDTSSSNSSYLSTMNSRIGDIDYGQYVVMNEDGLFLKANSGSYILNDTENDYITLGQDVTRVELSWKGLKMRNWSNQITFFASASTGDLFLSGTLNATKVYIQESDTDWNNALHGSYSLAGWYLKMFEDHVNVSTNLTNIFNKASEILAAARESQTAVNAINMTNYGILSTFFTDMSTKYTPVETTATSHPWNFKTGDIWNIPASGNTPATRWMATSNWDEVYNSENAAKANSALISTAGWTKVYNGAFAAITGATMKVDAEAGSIYLGAGNDITIESGGELNIGASSSLNLTSNGAINLNGSGLITLASTSGIKLLNSGKTVNIFNLDSNGITIGSGGKIKIESDAGIDIVSASNTSVSVITINRTDGILLGSSKKLSFSSSTSGTTGANVEIDPTRIIFGVSATGSTSFVEMQDTFIIAGVGENKASLEGGSNPSSSLTGLKITNSGIWLSTQSGNTTNLISMDHDGIMLGSLPQSGNNGSFVQIAKDKILIGSDSQLYINANNVELNTIYDGTGTAFRLGSRLDPELIFANGTLAIKGSITATSFILSSSSDYTQNKQWRINTTATAYTASSDPGTGWTAWSTTAPDLANNQGKYLHTKMTTTLGGQNAVTYDVSYISEDGNSFSLSGIQNNYSWNGTTYTLALTSTDSLLIGANNTSGGGIVITRDSSNKAVEITKSHINFDYSDSNYIHLDNDGIDLQGSHIKINGEEIWERGDILWGAEKPDHTGDSSWIWIRPDTNASLSYRKSSNGSANPGTGTATCTLTVQNNGNGFSTDNTAKYTYSVTITGHVKRAAANENYTYNDTITFALRDDNDSVSLGTRVVYCGQGVPDSGTSATCAKFTISKTVTGTNLTGGNNQQTASDITLVTTTPYYAAFVIDSATLTVETIGTSDAAAPCTVFFFPN